MNPRILIAGVMATTLGAALAVGCDGGPTCGAGTVEDGDTCIPDETAARELLKPQIESAALVGLSLGETPQGVVFAGHPVGISVAMEVVGEPVDTIVAVGLETADASARCVAGYFNVAIPEGATAEAPVTLRISEELVVDMSCDALDGQTDVRAWVSLDPFGHSHVVGRDLEVLTADGAEATPMEFLQQSRLDEVACGEACATSVIVGASPGQDVVLDELALGSIVAILQVPDQVLVDPPSDEELAELAAELTELDGFPVEVEGPPERIRPDPVTIPHFTASATMRLFGAADDVTLDDGELSLEFAIRPVLLGSGEPMDTDLEWLPLFTELQLVAKAGEDITIEKLEADFLDAFGGPGELSRSTPVFIHGLAAERMARGAWARHEKFELRGCVAADFDEAGAAEDASENNCLTESVVVLRERLDGGLGPDPNAGGGLTGRATFMDWTLKAGGSAFGVDTGVRAYVEADADDALLAVEGGAWAHGLFFGNSFTLLAAGVQGRDYFDSDPDSLAEGMAELVTLGHVDNYGPVLTVANNNLLAALRWPWANGQGVLIGELEDAFLPSFSPGGDDDEDESGGEQVDQQKVNNLKNAGVDKKKKGQKSGDAADPANKLTKEDNFDAALTGFGPFDGLEVSFELSRVYGFKKGGVTIGASVSLIFMAGVGLELEKETLDEPLAFCKLEGSSNPAQDSEGNFWCMRDERRNWWDAKLACEEAHMRLTAPTVATEEAEAEGSRDWTQSNAPTIGAKGFAYWTDYHSSCGSPVDIRRIGDSYAEQLQPGDERDFVEQAIDAAVTGCAARRDGVDGACAWIDGEGRALCDQLATDYVVSAGDFGGPFAWDDAQDEPMSQSSTGIGMSKVFRKVAKVDSAGNTSVVGNNSEGLHARPASQKIHFMCHGALPEDARSGAHSMTVVPYFGAAAAASVGVGAVSLDLEIELITISLPFALEATWSNFPSTHESVVRPLAELWLEITGLSGSISMNGSWGWLSFSWTLFAWNSPFKGFLYKLWEQPARNWWFDI